MAGAIPPVSPEPKEADVSLHLDWALLHRHGRTHCHEGPAAAAAAVKDDETAVAVETTRGQSGYFSFTLKPPPEVSFLKLHWPYGIPESSMEVSAHPAVVAADGNHVALRIYLTDRHTYSDTSDLFVYTASPSSPPSLLRLPPCPDLRYCNMLDESTGILCRGGRDDYVVADLTVTWRFASNIPESALFVVRAFFPNKGEWRVHETEILARQPQGPGDGRIPFIWTCTRVIPFGGRFLCWADYCTGMVICDFAASDDDDSPVLQYIQFPACQKYVDLIWDDHRPSFPVAFRSLSVSQGMMRFVHITNIWDWDPIRGPCRTSVPTITIWTLQKIGNIFAWKMKPPIDLNGLWAQHSYQAQGLPCHPPGFPLVSKKNPDVLCCVLREYEDAGKAWVIMLDMEKAAFLSRALYLNEQTVCCLGSTSNERAFCDTDLLPSDFCKYLNNSPGLLKCSDEVAINPSKRTKRTVHDI